MAEAPILDLSTKRERLNIKIDHVAYLLRTADDLTLAQFRTMERIAPRLAILLALDQVSDEDEQELVALLDVACAIAIDAPAALVQQLSPVARVSVFNVFTELLLPRLLQTRASLGATAGTAPMIGTGRSPVSNASMVATKRRGSRRSRSV